MTQDEYIISVTHEETETLSKKLFALLELVQKGQITLIDLEEVKWEVNVLNKELKRRLGNDKNKL